ncbi:testis-expressed basic protein 1 isoform X4 [Microcebus murinus]|uniref:testis-expressed basic protein 1 isoform X4 n=1 Tax=Microcebus murinus TaxID=30608 RepID=UPI003F6BE182
MAVLEITLAVILTLLGLAILAILLTRWTRRKQSEIYVSRYSSEQSAGLLDCEDGLQYAYSTESDTSYNDQEGSGRDYTPSTNSLALSRSTIASSQGSTSSIKCLKTTQEPQAGTPGPISGTIGPIMQFTAPVSGPTAPISGTIGPIMQFTPTPGATGSIKLSQKTIVQTSGPIIRYTGPSAETSETTSTESSCSSLTPIVLSQRTTTIAPMAARMAILISECLKYTLWKVLEKLLYFQVTRMNNLQKNQSPKPRF